MHPLADTQSTGPLTRPIFLIGSGRCGSTLLYEALAAHRDLAWFSYYLDRAPKWPSLAFLSRLCDASDFFRKAVRRTDQSASPLERFRNGPAEAYRVWEHLCGRRFRYEYLLGVQADPATCEATRTYVSRVVRCQGKRRFLAKITGPPRIGFVHSIFPDAIFIHVIRDGRAVVSSLLRVDFWRDTYRMHEPAWEGGMPEPYLERWQRSGRSPLVLAALQWRNLIEVARAERAVLEPRYYFELRYEDFVADPRGRLDALLEKCKLPPSPEVERLIERRFELRSMNEDLRARFDHKEWIQLNELLRDSLDELGYDV